MFTGIVQGKAIIRAIERKSEFMHLAIALPLSESKNLQIGASIALNGVCLTVTAFQENLVHFDLIVETLRITNLNALRVGDAINFERAAKFGDEIGGHLLSGYIHQQVPISHIEKSENNWIISFQISPELKKYIFPKGFIAINGCSLTIGEVKEHSFNVFLIPETLSITTFVNLKKGEMVNIEIDAHTQAIVDTTERYLTRRE